MSNNSNNENLNMALENLTTIKQILQKSRIQLNILSKLLLSAGIIAIIGFVLSFIGAKVLIYKGWYSLFPLVNSIEFILYGVLCLFFFKQRNTAKIHSSILTMNLFDFWGIIMFIMPLFQLVVMAITFILGEIGINVSAAPIIFSDCRLITFSSLIMGILVTGIVIKSNLLKTISILLMIVYPMMLLIFCTFNGATGNFNQIVAMIANRNSIGGSIQIIAYFTVGLYLRHFIGGAENGDK